MDKGLKELIEKYFAPKEGERIIKLLENKDELIRKGSNSNYSLIQRALRKLRLANELLKYEEIKNIVFRK